jgi:hypothetical protein
MAGYCDVFVIVNSVVSPSGSSATSKYGSSSVAAGATEMSQLSSLFVVAGEPDRNVASGAMLVRAGAANSDPATTNVANRAQTVSFFISISYTSLIDEYERRLAHPIQTIRSPPYSDLSFEKNVCQLLSCYNVRRNIRIVNTPYAVPTYWRAVDSAEYTAPSEGAQGIFPRYRPTPRFRKT